MTAQQTRKWTKESIQDLLNRNDLAVERAILRIYERQTWDEQESYSTRIENGKGFTGADAGFFSSLATQIQCGTPGHALTRKQRAKARKGIGKYWRQLLEVIDDQTKTN